MATANSRSVVYDYVFNGFVWRGGASWQKRDLSRVGLRMALCTVRIDRNPKVIIITFYRSYCNTHTAVNETIKGFVIT